MRILGGQYKGHALKLPRGIRSTSDKVRAAVFNILADAIEGARFLDVCAGSGAIGLEALSRGAAAVTWIEREPACCTALTANIERLGARLGAQLQVVRQEAPVALRQLGRRGAQFDLVFIDPPYRDISLLKKALQAIFDHAILPLTGWLIVEHDVRLDIVQLIENIEVVGRYRYGDTALSVCRHADASHSHTTSSSSAA